jgi:signal transduction histidine kinase
LKPYSLRLRLLLWAALWIAIALLVAGFAIGALFATNVEERVRQDLSASFTRLSALIDKNAAEPRLTAALTDPRYDTPFSGLYWQIEDEASGATGRSRSLWDFEIAPPAGLIPDGEGHFAVIDGPSGQTLTALIRQIRFDANEDARSYTVMLAEDRAILAASINQFGRDLALALAVLGAGLVAAAWLQVQFGLKPLKSVQAGVEAVRHGRAKTLDSAYPAEVTPLIGEVNDLLASQDASINFARARAADLAHGLKTPLAVLAATAPDLRARGDVATADLVEELSTDMADRIDYQLRLSRLHQRQRDQVLNASLNDALQKAVLVLRRTREGEHLDWQLDAETGLMVDIDPHDLIELVGVILENAAKWGKSQVSVRAQREGGQAQIRIGDDGPGLPEDQLPAILVRGARLDESRRGSGLGLAIAAEIVGLNRGKLELGRSGLGGLEVNLSLPLSA